MPSTLSRRSRTTTQSNEESAQHADPLTEANETFEDLDTQLRQIIGDNEELFGRFFELAQQRNDAISQIKTLMRESDFHGRSFRFGRFQAIRSVSRSYAPEVLLDMQPDILLQPGIVKAVDTDAIEDAVAAGHLNREVAQTAYREEERSPSVRGAKEIVFEL